MPSQTQADVKVPAASFAPQAFQFVLHGLRHTIDQIRKSDASVPVEGRHVSGQELCIGLRDYAIKEYGRLARVVLEHWGIRRTDDFGRIVFAMVEVGKMRKTDADSMEDFRCIFEFDEAFGAVEIGS